MTHRCSRWLSYKALADQGWTQKRIARAKGVSQNSVSRRLSFANFPRSVLDKFIQNDSLSESHATEITKLSKLDNLTPWLTRETAMLHIIERVTRNSKFTAKNFEAEVERFNGMIESVESHRQEFGRHFPSLLENLRGIYDEVGVQREIDKIVSRIAKEKREAERRAMP